MARKNADKGAGKSAAAKAVSTSEVIAKSAVRHSAVPRPAAVTIEVTHSQIARRAYEMYEAGVPGTELDHWLRAEQELRSGK